MTSNLPFEDWTSIFGSERLTGAHHVHILELNGDSYRLKQSKNRQKRRDPAGDEAPPSETGDPQMAKCHNDHPAKTTEKQKAPFAKEAFFFKAQASQLAGNCSAVDKA